MIRKTRLMSKTGVMLVRVEVFENDILRSTAFKVSTAAGGQTFTTLTKAITAFRAMSRHRVQTPRLKTAA
ncbi:hypothetical protein ACETK8_02595 [Brevundimonas staleyi]|uniref:Uncharacterized protein n=1 Tax=Brevundimonas staleyi TaxID=74326 RepID=A0ABW0FTJ4_9CAUL